jgi:hypothetical protein
MGPIEDGGGTIWVCTCEYEGGVRVSGGDHGHSDANNAPFPYIRYRNTSNQPEFSSLIKSLNIFAQ